MALNKMLMQDDERTTQGLYLFKALIKDGCQWHGDLLSTKWSEQLYVPADVQEAVDETLKAYTEDVDYKMGLHGILIA